MLKTLKKIIQDDYVVDYNKILYAAFFVYILAGHFVNHTSVFQIISIIFIVLEVIMIIKTKRMYLTYYTIIAIVFILYCLLQNLIGISIDNNQAMWMINTLIVNVFLNFATICYLMDGKNIYYFPKVYSQTGFIYLVYILITNISTLGSARLAWNQPKIFGLSGTYQSNGVGFIFAFAFLMYLYRILVIKERYCIIFAILCGVGAMLTGSRKALLIVLCGTFILSYLFYEGKNKIKIIIVGILAVVLMYISVMNVPIFYNTVGYRFDALLEGKVSGEQTEGSAIVREHLIDVAKEAFFDKPVWGHGLACFQKLDGTYGLYSHNNFMELLVDSGIVGFVIYYSVYVIALIRLIVSHIRKQKIGTLAMASLLIFVIMEYGNVTYFERPFQMFVMYACAVGIVAKREYTLAQSSNEADIEEKGEVFIDEFGDERQLIK